MLSTPAFISAITEVVWQQVETLKHENAGSNSSPGYAMMKKVSGRQCRASIGLDKSLAGCTST